MKVIICGDREFEDYEVLCQVIEESGFKITEVVSGGARGVDKLGETWAKNNKKKLKKFPAKWNDLDAPGAVVKTGEYGEYNAKAGFDRNAQMADYAQACIALFAGGNGTRDMIEQAEKRELKMHVHKIFDEEKGLIEF